MGTELQTKYQKLAHEYARLRAQVDVLKKGVVSEKTQRTQLEEELRLKDQALRKHLQENESLGFRNQQLSKRVQMLQTEMESSFGRSKKKNKDTPPLSLRSDVQAEELAAKITENERLHTRVFEITQKSEKLSTQLKEKITKLEQDVLNNDILVSELNKEHAMKLDNLQEEKVMLQAKLERVLNELSKAKEMNAFYGEDKGSLPVVSQPLEDNRAPTLMGEDDCQEYAVFNVSSVDRAVSSKLDLALSAAVVMVERFFANLSTVFMYIEQRCIVYPIDTSTGLHASPVNQKLCGMLQSLSVHTNELLGILQNHANAQQLSLSTGGGELLSRIGSALANFAVYLETTTAYIQLSIECESQEPVCGVQLTQVNSGTCHSFQLVSGIISTISEYVNALDKGDANSSTQAFIIDKLQSSAIDLHKAFTGLTESLNSKITMEYQLPFASEKLQMANECTISAVTSLSSAAAELVEYFKTHNKALLSSLGQTGRTGGNKKHQNQSVTTKLRQHAVSYYDKLLQSPCDQVPYELAVYLSRQFVGNTEKGDALEHQLQTLKQKLSKLEDEKCSTEIDYDKLKLKYAKISAQLEASGSASSPKALPPNSSTDDSASPFINTGLLGSLTSQELLVQADEDISTEMVIRQHSTTKIAEINNQLHETESKAAFLQSQCTVLAKQLEHNNATRKKLSTNLSTAEKSIQQLQDEVSTLSSGYDSQLSTMSDHLCELRDDLLKKEEELEDYRRNTSGKKKWNK